ncbi:MFS family permease [Aquimarina sp. EL_43]|uniref:DUF5687 family protein n=1 Tax=Aquimarina TaxID=290174 RepID=UPI00046F0F6A|nr:MULTISPECIES: DUF5687 family protein [Aquimarina]MBG6131681.1 MFS family permease [Aquimarina sp. EL_35]MBG6152142.1 MFS family permease [Aquimarina sp. EL_32]MBG6169914.1 MFS family permease [Aquimarina sp. EL_43]
MFTRFINLQWKSFWRSASLTSGLFMKFFMGFWALWFIVMMASGGIGAFFLIKEEFNLDPLETINRFLIYWLVVDLLFRYALQKMPVINIKPLLILPFKKRKIVSFAFGKTVFSFFNIIHAFFFIPFSIVLIGNEYPVFDVLLWNIGLAALIYSNNFLNIILNKKDNLIFIIGGVLAILGGLHYFEYFDITTYTTPFFKGLYEIPFLILIPIAILLFLITISFRSFVTDLYLDAGLATKTKNVKTENLEWLDRFGKTATFLKNDIKLIKRNKRARSTVLVSILFLFYGLLFFTGSVEAYDGPVWRIFAAIFVTGGFLLSFGQFVPSWDSSYYPLMMSQNIRYKEYLSSKWWLMVIATLISTVLASGYLYYGWEVYLAIVVGAIYNIGVNSHVVLWAGAYVKTPIDLTSNKNAFGDKQAFNAKTLLLSLPKMVLPMILYAIGHYAYSPYAGYALVTVAGIAGFAFKDAVFNKIERIYRTEKYKTIWAYKQKK